MTEYLGPRCYVAFDHTAADGKQLIGGWHYSTRIDPTYGEIPDRPLHLDNSRPVAFYEFATAAHRSWAEKHPDSPIVQLGSQLGGGA